MSVLIVERFSSSSRNCDPGLEANGEAVRIVHLRGDGSQTVGQELAGLAALPGRCVGALASLLLNRKLSSRDKRALIVNALATGGAGVTALAALPEIVRSLSTGKFQRIDCFSVRGFPLVPVLSQLFGIPYREFLADGTRYFGEFAFELLAVAPYAYWLHAAGRLRITQSSADTKCLYYFSPCHQELSTHRSYIPVTEYPNGATSAWRFDAHAFPKRLDTSRWIPPPYKAIYRNEIFRWSKEVCIICNKFTPEPSTLFHRPVNFIAVPRLLDLLRILTPRYQVVYVRPRERDIVNDHQPIREFGDFEAIQAHFPDVLTIQQLHAREPELTFNELQMRVFANCERFISVLGGSSYLASYFGGTNIVFAREGWEVTCGAYANWFHLFSGARVLRAASPRQLMEMVRVEFG